MNKRIAALFCGASVLLSLSVPAWPYDDGDALQLQCYRVATSSDKPTVTDGLIAAASDPADWKSSYVRVITNINQGGDTRLMTLLMANDNDTL